MRLFRRYREVLFSLTLLLPGSVWSSGSAGVDPAERPVHRHLLPSGSLDNVLNQSNLRLLSWKELNRLMLEGLASRKKAIETQQLELTEKALAPPPFRFSSLSLEARQDEDGKDVRIVLEAKVVVTAAEAQLIPLVGSGPTPESFSASLDGKRSTSSQLISVEGGWGALLPSAGIWNLELVSWLPVTQLGHLRQIQVAIPPVPGATGQIDLPGSDLEVFLDPAPGTELLTAPEGFSRSRAHIPPGTAFQAHWFPRDAGLEERPAEADEPAVPTSGLEEFGAKVFANWTQTLVLGQARMDALVHLQLQVHRAPISTVQVRYQGELENLECVRDPLLVESIQSVPGGLDIHLKGSRLGAIHLDLSYRYRDPEGHPSFELTVPQLHVQEAWSERSHLWVGRSTNVEIHPTVSGRIEPATDGRVPSFRRHPGTSDPLMVYRVEGPDALLKLRVERYPDAPVTTRIADTVRADTRLTERGRATTTLEIDLRDRRRTPLLVTLPEGSTATGFWRNQVRIPPPPLTEEGYRFPLQAEGAPSGESASLKVSYQQDLKGGTLGAWGSRSLELARFDSPVMELSWSLTPPPGYRLHGVSSAAVRNEDGIQIQRQVLEAGNASSHLSARFRFLSRSAREISRLIALLVGALAGWLLCALLVGSAPLATGVGLLAPALLAWMISEPAIPELCLSGALSAFSIGIFVGLIRWWSLRQEESRSKEAHLEAVLQKVHSLRERLSAAMGKLPPLPETPPEQTPPPVTESEPEIKPEPDAEPEPRSEREPNSPEAPPPDPPDPAPTTSKKTDSKRRKGRSS